MWLGGINRIEESKDPKFLEEDTSEFKAFKERDLKGKFGSFCAFGEQNNFIYAFAKALYDKLQLSSEAEYKKNLVYLLKQRKTFCNVNVMSNYSDEIMTNYDKMKAYVLEAFKGCFISFETLGLDISKLQPKYRDFEFKNFASYTLFCEHTFAINILSTLFGVSSVIYTEISFEDKECEIEIYLPELQGLRPTLYFYACANEGGTYSLYKMTPREDLLAAKQRKKIVMSKNDQFISQNIRNVQPLLGYMKDLGELYDKIISRHLGENHNPEEFEREVVEDLAFIRANKNCNNLDFTLKAFTGSEKIHARILKYEKLKLNYSCNFCLGLDQEDDRIFNLDCSCFTHQRCVVEYVQKFIKAGSSVFNCLCGELLNMQLILSLFEKKDADSYWFNVSGKFTCDKCNKMTRNADPHNQNCKRCLCEECSIKSYKNNIICTGCKNTFLKDIDQNSNILCKTCNSLKPLDEIFIPSDHNPIACFTCYLTGKLGNNLPNELNDLCNAYQMQCDNDNCFSVQNGSNQFFHPSKYTCSRCVNLCFNCVIKSNSICPLCGGQIQKIYDLFDG